jgi:hypothetical protein
VTDTDPQQWSVVVPLWTSEEGRSDLTRWWAAVADPGMASTRP